MIGNIIYAVAFVVTLMLQSGVVTSWPEPYRFFPLALIVGIIILHEKSMTVGASWIALSGVILEARGLGSGLAFASVIAALTAVGIATFVFAKRSFWALMGVGMGTALVFVLARWLWSIFRVIFTPVTGWQTLEVGDNIALFFWAVLGVFLFGAYIRRLIRWSGTRFVNKSSEYDVSFPQ